MKCVSIFAALLVLTLAFPLAAQQDKPADNMSIVREAMRADKKVVVAENMQLGESEAKVFWPVYDEYQKELTTIGDRTIKLIENYAANYQTMTDETAGSLVKEMMSIQGERLKIQEKYLPKFQKVLPMTKVARFYQIENKLRAIVDYDLAAQIPLVK